MQLSRIIGAARKFKFAFGGCLTVEVAYAFLLVPPSLKLRMRRGIIAECTHASLLVPQLLKLRMRRRLIVELTYTFLLVPSLLKFVCVAALSLNLRMRRFSSSLLVSLLLVPSVFTFYRFSSLLLLVSDNPLNNR